MGMTDGRLQRPGGLYAQQVGTHFGVSVPKRCVMTLTRPEGFVNASTRRGAGKSAPGNPGAARTAANKTDPRSRYLRGKFDPRREGRRGPP